MALEDLGIDARIAHLLRADGIEDLYPPQKDAWKAVKDGKNALVSIPTASGKSLVAYLAMLHRFLATGKKSLYIVPLRALASEKYDELRHFRSLGLTVGVATGDLDEKDPRLGRFDIIVCTSEKADALLRHRAGWLSEIGCVVADELHLVNDAGRGPTLEVILTRFRSLYPNTQLVGLSATMQNAPEIAKWLGGTLVTSTWRPVKLKTGTYTGNALEFLGEKPVKLDAGGDPVASLVEDVIKQGGQALVFVSTRRSAEAQAQKLGGVVRALLDASELANLQEVAKDIGGDGEESSTSRKLAKLIAAGVAYHTAGLDSHQRRTLEKAFRDRRIKVLCATPTLAAGVNTPARRVIIRDLSRFESGEGNRPLPVMEVRQMMGRAGRPRYDPVGEAVLLAKSADQKEAIEETYLRGEVEAVTSKLAGESALRMHVLATIAGDYADSREDLDLFFAHTFWAQETSDWIVRDRIDDVVAFLEDNGFLEEAAGSLRATPFGRRTSDLYIDPFSALRLREALHSGKEATPFHILQCVAGCPDVFPLYLRSGDDWVQERFWPQHEGLLCKEDGRDLEAAMSYAKTAFLLMDWMDEKPMDQLEEVYQVGPGDVRTRLDGASWLLHAFRELARTLKPTWLQPLDDLTLRLEHGVKPELLPLIRLKGIGRIRARTLHAAGFRNPNALRGVPVERIAALHGFGSKLAQEVLRQVGDKAGDIPEPPAPTPQDAEGQSSLARWHP